MSAFFYELCISQEESEGGACLPVSMNANACVGGSALPHTSAYNMMSTPAGRQHCRNTVWCSCIRSMLMHTTVACRVLGMHDSGGYSQVARAARHFWWQLRSVLQVYCLHLLLATQEVPHCFRHAVDCLASEAYTDADCPTSPAPPELSPNSS